MKKKKNDEMKKKMDEMINQNKVQSDKQMR